MATEPADLSRDLFGFQLRGFPGAAHASALPPSGAEKAAVTAHAKWFGCGGRPLPGRGDGEPPECGWLHHRARGASPLPGRYCHTQFSIAQLTLTPASITMVPGRYSVWLALSRAPALMAIMRGA